jgi:outer membrane murein-binding lipoprotein Lpp
MLMANVQELNARVDALVAKNEELEARLASLEGGAG